MSAFERGVRLGRLTTIGTPGTYTEFLTCLEMKRDARKLNNSLDREIGR